jgi:hypothetical protein
MFALLHSLAMFAIGFFKSPRRLEVENLFLRNQLSIRKYPASSDVIPLIQQHRIAEDDRHRLARILSDFESTF